MTYFLNYNKNFGSVIYGNSNNIIIIDEKNNHCEIIDN